MYAFRREEWLRILDEFLQIPQSVLSRNVSVELRSADNLAEFVSHFRGGADDSLLKGEHHRPTRLRVSEQQRTDDHVCINDDEVSRLSDQALPGAPSALVPRPLTPQEHR